MPPKYFKGMVAHTSQHPSGIPPSRDPHRVAEIPNWQTLSSLQHFARLRLLQVVLRNPVDRAVSLFYHRFSEGVAGALPTLSDMDPIQLRDIIKVSYWKLNVRIFCAGLQGEAGGWVKAWSQWLSSLGV